MDNFSNRDIFRKITIHDSEVILLNLNIFICFSIMVSVHDFFTLFFQMS